MTSTPTSIDTQIVNTISRRVIRKMQRVKTTSYHHSVSNAKSIPYVLTKVKQRFPGVSIKHTLLSKGTDGKMYDISTIDDTKLHLVSSVEEDSFILIDWS